MSNDHCKELNKGKGKDDKEVAKKVVSKPGKAPSGTPSVSDSEGEDKEHSGQAVYHFCREVHYGSRTLRVDRDGKSKKIALTKFQLEKLVHKICAKNAQHQAKISKNEKNCTKKV